MTPHPSTVTAARAIAEPINGYCKLFCDARQLEPMPPVSQEEIAKRIEDTCHVSEMVELLKQSQEFIGGDWRERRDALLAKVTK